MKSMTPFKRTTLAVAIGAALSLGLVACDGDDDSGSNTSGNAWMTAAVVAEQAAATTDTAREAVANRRAKLLLAALTPEQKMQQLTGSTPEIVPELPQCFGARHVTGIAALNVPTLRITNGPVGLGQ